MSKDIISGNIWRYLRSELKVWIIYKIGEGRCWQRLTEQFVYVNFIFLAEFPTNMLDSMVLDQQSSNSGTQEIQHVAVKHAKDLSEVSYGIGSAYTKNASFQHIYVNLINLS